MSAQRGHDDRDRVVDALRPSDVAAHLGIKGQWRGRWLRSRRCGEADHSSEAFGLSALGRWHCFNCDKGGDLLSLLALGSGLDIRADFPKLLELAAGIAGIELVPGADLMGLGPPRPEPKPRPAEPPQIPIEQRIIAAKRRAAWVWERLYDDGALPASYLRTRGLDPDAVLSRETIKSTPIRIPADLRQRIDSGRVTDDTRILWSTMGVRRGTHAIVAPIRCVDGRGFVDLRCRRVEPLEGQPKIIGMVGNVCEAPADAGKTRQLIGCYGDPASIDSDLVVLTEGMMDYLTALWVFPNAHVLGAVNAGTLGILARHAATALAARDDESRLLIVEQSDPPRTLRDGRVVSGAADAAINEDPNAATKAALRILRSPARVGWLFCNLADPDGGADVPQAALGGKPVKDLNDLVRVGADINSMVAWWKEPIWSDA